LQELEKRQNFLAEESRLCNAEGQSRRFLVVEIDSEARKAVEMMLISQGQKVALALDGLDCLRLYDEGSSSGENPFDVILMNDDMALLTGLETTKRLRSRGCKCIILGVSVHMRDYEVKAFIEHGADAVLSKPLTLESLELALAGLP
jgi:two-component system phosphate regulon response regulator PhoB